jgi:hypothetical protein
MPREERRPDDATFAFAREFAREPRSSEDNAVWSALVRARRGSVAVWIAVMTPVLLIAVSMGVEVGSWAAAEVSMLHDVPQEPDQLSDVVPDPCPLTFYSERGQSSTAQVTH